MNPGEHALYKPRGAPEQLLGLSVSEGADGQWVIAESREPGCEVVVKTVPMQWERHFVENVGRAAVFEVGRADVLGLQADYGKTLRIESEVANIRVVQADLRGPCGDEVIKTVYIGTGWREVQYQGQARGGAGINIEGVPVNASGGGWDRVGGRLAWSQPQAWAFEIGSGQQDGADLRIEMPAEIAAGSTFTPEIDVERPVWLVVLYRDAEGNHGVVMPSPELPAYRAAAGTRVALPTFEAVNLPGHAEDHETLLVYGFVEEGDFKAFAPPAGALTIEQANAYAERLQQRLDDPTQIPRVRWTSTTFGYRIVAAPSPPER